ncbi:hypothetical protein PINS_up021459 [Pythium insidiosum]|nr:hypothetical protein PINS_up021459 [Pythium insidiosum]
MMTVLIQLTVIPVADAANATVVNYQPLTHLSVGEPYTFHVEGYPSGDKREVSVITIQDAMPVVDNIMGTPDMWEYHSNDIAPSAGSTWLDQRKHFVWASDDEDKLKAATFQLDPIPQFIGEHTFSVQSLTFESNTVDCALHVEEVAATAMTVCDFDCSGELSAYSTNVLDTIMTVWWHHAQGPTLEINATAIQVYEDEVAIVRIETLELDDEDRFDSEAVVSLYVGIPEFSDVRLTAVEGMNSSAQIASNGSELSQWDASLKLLTVPSTTRELAFQVDQKHQRQVVIVSVIAISHAFATTNVTEAQVQMTFMPVAIAPLVSIQFSTADPVVSEDDVIHFNVSGHLNTRNGQHYLVIYLDHRVATKVELAAIGYDALDRSFDLTHSASSMVLYNLPSSVNDSETHDTTPETINATIQVSLLQGFSGSLRLEVGVFSITDDVVGDDLMATSCVQNSTVALDIVACLDPSRRKSLASMTSAVDILVRPIARAPTLHVAPANVYGKENSAINFSLEDVALLDMDGSETVTVDMLCKVRQEDVWIRVSVDDRVVEFDERNGSSPPIVVYHLVELSATDFDRSDTNMSTYRAVQLVPRPYFSGVIQCVLVITADDHYQALANQDTREIAVPVDVIAQPSGVDLIIDTVTTDSNEDDTIVVRNITASLRDRDGSKASLSLCKSNLQLNTVSRVEW